MDRLKGWLDQLEARTLRERLLLMAAMLALPAVLGYLLWLDPQLQERQQGFDKISRIEKESDQFLAQIGKLEATLQKDPDRKNRERLSTLKEESQRLDRRLRQEQKEMISPELMPKLLEDMLGNLPLELVHLHKLAPEIEIENGIKGTPKVYRHGLRLELEGSYRDTLKYLERLENLPWRLAWEALDIKMKDYPKATIILNVYTLSFDEVWLGV